MSKIIIELCGMGELRVRCEPTAPEHPDSYWTGYVQARNEAERIQRRTGWSIDDRTRGPQ